MHIYEEGLIEQFGGLLGVLGYHGSDRISVCHKNGDAPMKACVVAVDDAPMKAAEVANAGDVWFGVGVLSHDFESDGYTRGRVKDVVRIPALFADLDGNEGKLGSEAACREVVDMLSEQLGRPPAAIVHSGTGGLHPYWRLDDYEPGQHPIAKRLLKQFGKVVQAVAVRVGGMADDVSDVARVLRVPGTENQKEHGGMVTVEFPDVAPEPLTLQGLDAALNPGATEMTRAARAEWTFQQLTTPMSTDGPVSYQQAFVQQVGGSAAMRSLDPYEQEYVRVRIRETVKEDLAANARAGMPDYVFGTLTEMLALPPQPPFRIDGLLPPDATLTIVSQRKAGKTTLTGNLANSFISGSPFLGQFEVLPIEEDNRVGMLNFEVSAHQHSRWLDDMGIPQDRVWTAHLRGCRNPFADKEGRRLLAERLKAARVETLIVDPFANAFTGDNPNDDASVTPFLNMLQEFARTDVGVRDLALVVHSGWTEGRSRGSSRLEDWPDAIWVLRKDKDTGLRYFSADGRDVALDEHSLVYDPNSRLLTLGMSTAEAKEATKELTTTMMMPEVLQYIAKHPGASVNDIKAGVPYNAKSVANVVAALIEAGKVDRVQANRRGGGYAHFLKAAALGSGSEEPK